MTDERVYILDSTVFIEGYAQSLDGLICMTVPGVVSEVRQGKAAIEMDMMLKLGLKVSSPHERFMRQVERTVKKTKDGASGTDIQVVALALQMSKTKGVEAVIASDDYAVQNLAKKLGLAYVPVSQEGIKKEITWVRKCTNCGRYCSGEECEICGAKTRRSASR